MRRGETGRDGDELPDGATVTSSAEAVGCDGARRCAQTNLNIYPVCLAVAPAGGDISHL